MVLTNNTVRCYNVENKVDDRRIEVSKGKLIWIPDYDDEPSGCAIFAVVIIIGLILFGLSKCGIIEDPGYIDNTNENTQVDYTAEYVGIASFPYESDYVEQTEGKYDVKKYPTNGYFQYFFGSLSVGYGSPNDVIEILIYADNTLVYRSGDINYDTGSIELKINVNQCNTLKIVKFQPSTNENNNIQCTINNGYLTNKEVDLYTAVKGLETSGDEGFSGFYGENHVIENFYGQPFNGPVFYIWTGTNEAVPLVYIQITRWIHSHSSVQSFSCVPFFATP